MNHINGASPSSYRAGKWGRYLRAPDIYFDIMHRFGERFFPLGEIASIRFGVKSGCDAFFMPRDMTAEVLAAHQSDHEFRKRSGGAPRKDVESGRLRVVKAGDGTVHPIEAEYLAPELHTLRKMVRTVVRAVDLDRVVLLVKAPLNKLKVGSPWVWRYLSYGATATFASGKSKLVPVPKRSTCAARQPWYDLTGLLHPGLAFWPMAHHYTHVIPANPERLVCNHRLFDVGATDLSQAESRALVAILNSTLIGLWKNFFGRYTGTEGSLDTEVIDAKLVYVPDPRGISTQLAKRLEDAFQRMSKREVGRLVEEQLMDCHSPERARRLADGPLVLSNELRQPDRRELDDAVLELLGVSEPAERQHLIDQLYEATARHFREIRVVEVQKMEQRAKSNGARFRVDDLAADIWDAAELEDAAPLGDWLGQQPESDALVILPDERPASLSRDVMFSPSTVYFGKGGKTHIDCQSRGQAELVTRLANLGVVGQLRLPRELSPCLKVLDRLDRRVEITKARFQELAESRTGDERIQDQLAELLMRWFVVGRAKVGPGTTRENDADGEEG